MSTVDVAAIDPKEREALIEFRERIRDVLVNFNEYKRHDLWLLRWLRARELNIDAAEDLLRKSLDRRAKEKIDEIFEWNVPDELYQKFPLKASGVDKDGCVVASVPFGKWDVRSVVALGAKETSEFIRYTELLIEQVMRFAEHSSTKEKMISQFVMIFDLEGLSLMQITSRETVECILEIVRLFEANHPETLKAAWVVNAPKIFEILYAVVKPLLTARTLSKVQIFGFSTESWRTLLRESIKPDQLPSEYGGTNTSCKPYKVSYGFDVFTDYEVFPNKDFFALTVNAGSKHVVEFPLAKDNKLSWNFRTTDYDIGFALLYSSSEAVGAADDGVIIFSSRADSHVLLQRGAYVADKPGTYSLVFDNSFSRFRSKSLFYCARVS